MEKESPIMLANKARTSGVSRNYGDRSQANNLSVKTSGKLFNSDI